LKESGENITQVLLIDPYPNEDAAKKLWPKATVNILNPLYYFNIEDYL